MATSTQRASSRFDRSPWECPYALIPLVEVEPYADPTGYFQNAGIGLRQPRPDSRRPTVYDGDDNARSPCTSTADRGTLRREWSVLWLRGAGRSSSSSTTSLLY